MPKCRFRYSNNSPKQSKWFDTHEWIKRDKWARPQRFPKCRVGIKVRWEFDDGARVATGNLNRIHDSKMGTWFHATAMVAKQRRRAELGDKAFRKTPKRKRRAPETP